MHGAWISVAGLVLREVRAAGVASRRHDDGARARVSASTAADGTQAPLSPVGDHAAAVAGRHAAVALFGQITARLTTEGSSSRDIAGTRLHTIATSYRALAPVSPAREHTVDCARVIAVLNFLESGAGLASVGIRLHNAARARAKARAASDRAGREGSPVAYNAVGRARSSVADFDLFESTT